MCDKSSPKFITLVNISLQKRTYNPSIILTVYTYKKTCNKKKKKRSNHSETYAHKVKSNLKPGYLNTHTLYLLFMC